MLLIGCAQHNSQEISATDSNETLSVSVEQQGAVPLVKTSSFLGGYGPSPDSERLENQQKDSDKGIVLGLFIGAGGSRSLAVLEFLKEIERKKIRIASIGGVGLGAVIAAYYAAGISLADLEWSLYRFFKRSKGVKFYSPKWLALLDQIVLDRLDRQQITQCERNLIIPLYDKTKKRVIWITEGFRLRKLLKLNFYLAKSENNLQSALGREFQLDIFKQRLGVDYLMSINPLQRPLLLKKVSGFILGNLERERYFMQRRELDSDLVIDLPKQMLELDGVTRIAKFILAAKKISELVTLQLEYKVHQ